MKIRYVYLVSDNRSGAVVGRNNVDVLIEVSGEPDEHGRPSISQLWEAERKFFDYFEQREAGLYLISYVSGPADGSRGRYSEYRAYLPVT